MARPTHEQCRLNASAPSQAPSPGVMVVGLATGTPASGRGPNVLLPDNRLPASFRSLAQALCSESDDIHRVRVLARMDPDTSMAKSALVNLADTDLTLSAYSPDGQASAEGGAWLQMMLFKMYRNVKFDGYDSRPNLHQVIRTLLCETVLGGGCGVEAVLDKYRLPDYLQPVPTASLKWRTVADQVSTNTPIQGYPVANLSGNAPSSVIPRAYKIVPYQTVMGHFVVLDIPTFMYASLDQDPSSTDPTSLFETDIKAALLYENALGDIHRVVSTTGHSRLDVSLDVDSILKTMPESVRTDPSKWDEWLEAQRLAAASMVNNLEPNQGFIHYSHTVASYINSEIGAGADYSPYIETLDARRSASLKTPATVLGKRPSAGSQNTSSTEAILHLQLAQAVQSPVAANLSKAFTLGLRMYGFDGYCEAKFAKPSLRPDIELAGFKSMDQAVVLRLLSLGRVSDDEAQTLLGLPPLPPDAPRLSGTLFMDGGPQAAENFADPTSNADPLKRAATGNLPEAEPGNKPQRT